MQPRTPIFHHIRLPLALVAINVAFAAAFMGTALSAFHAPTPHAVPVGIVAAARVDTEVGGALAARAPGGFDLHAYPSRAQATAAIDARRMDGALIASPRGMTLLVAQAGGTAPAQLLTNTFTTVAAKRGQQLQVTDVVPPLPNDSLALSSFFTVLCVLFPSLATGAATAHLFRRHRTAWRIAVPTVAAVAIGLSAAAVASAITGFHDYLPVAGIVALFSLAISAPTAALGRIRLPLIALAVITFLIVGLPVSGGPSGLGSFGPGFLRALDSVLPLGVAADAVRNTIYFHASDTTGYLWVLGGWAAAGVGVLLAHPVRRLVTHYGLRLSTAH
ncbi:MAG TPA: hypothetical protein VMF14_12745 [Solirubrobacteraceae bacterium]|nr:hypothetical protein [Solirubrobacteraceae bacterium]